MLLAVFIFSCKQDCRIGTWTCDGTGRFIFLDRHKQLDSMSLSTYYIQSNKEAIGMRLMENGKCWIQSYDKKWDCTYTLIDEEDSRQIIIERDTMAIDEIVITINTISSGSMNVALDFKGENIYVKSTMNQGVD